jgi:hypothetical protein
MNKMQALAKTLLTIIGVYWLIMIGFNLLSILYVWGNILSRSSSGMELDDMLVIIPSLLIIIFSIIVILYILKKRDKLALKIAGSPEIQNIDAEIKWIPFAYRLISVLTGMYCLYRACGSIPGIAAKLFYGSKYPIPYGNYSTLILSLIAGIYLLCGAPHFVRWQTKKTIEMCTE